MARGQALVCVAAAAMAALVVLGSTSAAGEDDAAALVRQLPTNGAFSNVELEKRIAALGAAALPALEPELRLGIRFRVLDELLKAQGSRRSPVASVLARIPGDASTDLLVSALSDPPDNYGMTVGILEALEQRTLSPDQIVALLANEVPLIVLAGFRHKDAKVTVPEIEAAIERLFDKDVAQSQFRNEYGASTASADALWEVRLAAGKALKKDMLPEIRARAVKVLADLEQEALHPTDPDRPVFISNASRAELTICDSLNKLHSLGEPIRDLVEKAATTAAGNHAKILDMALARFGDPKRVAKVPEHLSTSDSPTVRYCAATTLRNVGEKSSVPALRKALRDPYQRRDGSCVRIGDGMIYPVRQVAADALVRLGEDPRQVWGEARK
jgi:HEAT repeat protein